MLDNHDNLIGKIAKKILPQQIREPIHKLYYKKKKDFRTYYYYDFLKKKKVFGNQMYLKKPSFVSSQIARTGYHEKLEKL